MRPTFSRLLLLDLAALLLAGCFAGERRIDPTDLRAVEIVTITAMQHPPLLLPPDPYGSTIARVGLGTQFPPLLLLGGMIAAVDLPAAVDRADAQASALEQELRDQATWVPTVVLADALRLRLASAHPAWAVAVAPRQAPLPGVVDQRRTWHMRNWYGPVQDWYGVDVLRSDAAPPRVLAVEVGIANFEVYGDSLLLHVLVKVTAADGHVLGRARAVRTQPLESGADVLAEEAAALKVAIIAAGTAAIDEIAVACGLLPDG